MIRLTEVEQNDLAAKIKLEGDLTGQTLPIFAAALADYAARDIQALRIDASGLLRVDQAALEKARTRFPPTLHLVFYTALRTHLQQLQSCGLDAEYKP